jgi:serine/threonine-protein kinase
LALVALVILAIVLLQAPDRVRVPNVVGSQIAVAQPRMEKAGFEVVAVRANSSKPRNEVIGQSPGPNATADKGSRVTLNISDGPVIGAVPSVVGDGRKAAAKKLTGAGFRVRQEEVFSDDVRINHVISESPSGGSQAERGSLVTLTISKGPEQATVPDVVGKTEDEAVNAIEGANFTVSVRRRESSSADPGTVLSQDPAGATQAPNGSRITITVAQAPAPVTVPNVVGRSEDAARAILERRHFKVTVEQTSVTSPDDDGVVQEQSPGAGGDADSGSTVTITVGSFDPDLNPDSPPPPPPPPPATTTP